VEVGANSQITDLTEPDHACLTFGDREELFDLTAAFVRDGLATGLKVIWLGEAGPRHVVPELERRGIAVAPALASGQMAAAEWEGRLLSGQAFEAGPAVGWLSGQMAASRREEFPGLALALAEAVRLQGDITINMSGLAFIDGSCARMIVDAARGLGGSRVVALQCRAEIAARFVLLGAGKVAGVVVETVDDA
jgi:anti-anti-sigma regulatory factor